MEASKKRNLAPFLNVPWSVLDAILGFAAWVVLEFLLGLIIVAGAPHFSILSSFLTGLRNGDITASFILNAMNVVPAFGVVAFYLHRYRVTWRSVGWRSFDIKKMVLYLIVLFFGFIILANVVLLITKLLVPGFDPNQAQTNDFTDATHTHRNLALVALVLLPPVFEETIFRGFIFPALSKKWGVVAGAIGSSVLFGLAHGQANLFVYTSILGLVLCFMYTKLGSIFPGMALHMINNYLAFLMLSSK